MIFIFAIAVDYASDLRRYLRKKAAATENADTTLSEFLMPCERISNTSSASEMTSGSSPNRSFPSSIAHGNSGVKVEMSFAVSTVSRA